MTPKNTTLLRLALLVYTPHAFKSVAELEEESKVIELFSPWGRPGSFSFGL